jgi:low density lipoprotein-related protein 2
LDSVLRRVYWADAHKGTIEYANWNGAGTPVELRLAKIQVPFSVAVFEANVIWNDLGSTAILSADKRFENSTRVLRKKVVPADFKIYHPIVQPPYPQRDPCSDPQTANCSHICVLMPSGFSCLCPDGYNKITDFTCQVQYLTT